MGDLVRDYLDWLGRHRRPQTARESRYAAEAHILPAFGELPAAGLDAERIRRWHELLAERPARLRTSPRAGPQKYQPVPADEEARRARKATANRILGVLRAALNRAHQAGRLASDEGWRRVKPFPRADAARMRWLSKEECRRLLSACPPDFRRLVHGALLTGARYAELCRALVRAFDAGNGTLHARESKSGRPRHIPLDGEALAFLRAVTAGRAPDEAIFPRENGGTWGKSHQVRPIAAASDAARLDPPANFHCLRHTWASHRVMAGAPLIVVAQVLGHADTRMVEKHYGHRARPRDRRGGGEGRGAAAGRVGSVFNHSAMPIVAPCAPATCTPPKGNGPRRRARGGFTNEAQQAKRSGSRRSCQAPRAAPARG